MRILVIGNSRHHSSNLILLSETLQEIYKNLDVVIVCDPKDSDFYKSKCKLLTTKVVPFQFFSNIDNEVIESGCDKVVSGKIVENNFLFRIHQLASLYAKKNKIAKLIIQIAKHTTFGCLFLQKKNSSFYKKLKTNAISIIENINPTVIFSFGDRHIDIEAPILSAAKDKKIPVIIPYLSYSDKSGLIAIRKVQKDLNVFSFPSLYRFFALFDLNNQIYQNYFYQTPSVLYALKKINALSQNPWTIGNGNSDVICVDSLFTAKRYFKDGVNKKKIEIIGDISYDILAKQNSNKKSLRLEVCNQYLIDKNDKIVILALPQFAEQGLMEWDEHWNEILHLIEEISKIDAFFLISLHPRMNLNDYRTINTYKNIAISKQPLNEILPIADLFVAINSSTVIWSILCGVPVCVLNYFNLDMSIFNHLKSLYYINKKYCIQTDLNKVLDCLDSFDLKSDWDVLSREKVFDGNVIERYYQLIIN